MVNRAAPPKPDANAAVLPTQGRGKVDTARVQSVRPPDDDATRPEARTAALSTVSQVGDFLIHAEIIHEERWDAAVAKVGTNNLHLILAELVAPLGSEDDPASMHALRERRLTRYQIDQILGGRLSNLVLGPFLLRKRLGRGGMAEVLQAYNRELDRIEAVKVLRTDKQRPHLDLAALVRREARVLASLVHPNITTIFRADTAYGVTYLSMEYVPGETVEAKVSQLTKAGEHMPVEEAIRIVLEASFALGYAHSRQVVHRDVKPGNIMVTPDGRVKVLDVGIAAIFAPDKEEAFGKGAPKDFSSLAGFGTPHYMAPEQWKDNETTAAVDVYGLAATLFHMLVGRPPFPEKDLEVLLARKKEGAVDPSTLRRDLPRGLGAVLQRALSGDPAQRYASMEAFAAALEPFAGDRPSPSPQRPPVPWIGVFGVLALSAIAIKMEPAAATIPLAVPPELGVVERSLQDGPRYRWNGKDFDSIPQAAAAAEEQGDKAAAAGLFLEAAAADPAAAAAHRKRAGELLEAFVAGELKDHPQRTLKSADWAIKLAPDSWKLLELKGLAFRHQQRWEEAAAQFDLAAAKAPGEAQRLQGAAAGTLRQLAEAQSKQKQFKQADQTLRDAAERYPVHAAEAQAAQREVLIQWATALVDAQDDLAATVVADARKAAPGRPEPLLLQARLFERGKNWSGAAAAWMEWGVVAKDAKQAAEKAAACWRGWGKEAAGRGDHRAAAERFGKAKELLGGRDPESDPLLATSLNHLGFALHQRGEEAAAVAEYTRAINAVPDAPLAYRNRGFSYLQLKNFEAAERDYSAAIERDRTSAVAFRMRGAVRLLHLPQKNWKAILDDFLEAARLDPEDAKTNYFLAYIYANCPDGAHRNGTRAVLHADRACKATKYGDWEHLAMLAAAHAEAGQFDAALTRIAQAERLAPDVEKADLKALAEAYRTRK